ncbi:MAG: alginate export family protein [Candidatus Tectomicrobia bacterium]|nr:alginate export family protein [Candidatus Tectomicrobia bacterium]
MTANAPWQGIRLTLMIGTIGLVLLLTQAYLSHAEQTSDAEGIQALMPALPDWLTFVGQLEIEITRQQNFNLTPPKSDTRTVIRPEFEIETHVQPWEPVEALLVFNIADERAIQDDTDAEEPDDVIFELKEVYVRFNEILDSPLSLQIGRQSFEDPRQWLYDEEIDAVRLFYHTSRFYLEAAIARVAIVEKDLINRHDTDDTDYLQLYGEYDFGPPLKLAAYVIAQDDNMPMGERPVFLGMRARGELLENLSYWLDTAHIRGKDDKRHIRAWGVDVGLTYLFDLPWEPLLIFSFAFGSGDGTPDSSTDTRFRQTGLQGNGAEFETSTEIQYYGEVLDSELSNLLIFTAGMTVHPLPDTSLTVMYHAYRQPTLSSEFREIALDAEPTGESRDVGSEIDLMGIWEIGPAELKLVFGAFFPGNAFEAETGTAFFTQLRLQVQF